MSQTYTIYLATNKVNSKRYVGYDSRWPNRMRSHLATARSKNASHYKQHLHHAILKHGEDNFTWEVIYQSKERDHTLLVMEEYFITLYRTFVGFSDGHGYNLTLGGEGQKGRPVTEETRAKKSAALFNRKSPMSRSVVTPHGKFEGVSMAARALGLHNRTVLSRISSSICCDWYYEDEPKEEVVRDMSGYQREISTPFGIFDSAAQCAASTGVSTSTIASRLQSNTMRDWSYTGNTSRSRTRAVVTPHGGFESAAACAKYLGISRSTVAVRLASKHWTDWTYE